MEILLYGYWIGMGLTVAFLCFLMGMDFDKTLKDTDIVGIILVPILLGFMWPFVVFLLLGHKYAEWKKIKQPKGN